MMTEAWVKAIITAILFGKGSMGTIQRAWQCAELLLQARILDADEEFK